MRYQLPEGILLDLPRASLRRGQQELRLKPKAFDTLVYLVEQRRRLVRKQELLEAIWKDVYVTEDALVQAIADVREALCDSPEVMPIGIGAVTECLQPAEAALERLRAK